MSDPRSKAASFVARVAGLRFGNVFNPYTDVCTVYDLPNAPAIRRRNLEAALVGALTSGVDSLWVGRDLGHKGGRRTGLALTDERNLTNYMAMSSAKGLKRATKGKDVTEATAKVIWRALERINGRVFMWNIFPLHPHNVGSPFTNRTHTRGEAEACKDLLDWLITELSPATIVGIGADAQRALAKDYKISRARHPSHGGQTIFLRDIERIYALTSD